MKILKKYLVCFLATTVLLMNSVSVEARSFSKKMFQDQLKEEGITMSLKGTARKRAFFMRVFTAGLYMEDSMSAKDVLKDTPKSIEVLYHYPIPGKKLAQYTKDQMKLNLNAEEYQKVKKSLPKLDQLFVDLKPGDRYALTYIPDKGTKFVYNGKEVGLIEGSEFGKGIFAVWFGEKPMDRHLKAEMLGLLPSVNEKQTFLLEEDADFLKS